MRRTKHPLRPATLLGALALSTLVLGAGCDGKGGDPDGGSATPPAFYCPGQAGCESGAAASDALIAGAAAVTITPPGYEVPLPEYLERAAADGQCDIGDRCGELIEIATKDCGTDMLCRGDTGYSAPDSDGTEKDGIYDFFQDCGTDRICPGDATYVAPDADGTEGNGIFDGLWLAGFGNNRPATGVHDDLWARAAILGRGDVKVALVYLDLVGFFNTDVEKVREAVRTKRPEVHADLDFIQVGSTHVHEAPDTMGQWGLIPPGGVPGLGVPAEYKSGVNSVWMSYIIDRTSDAIIEAYDATVPATAAATSGRTGAAGLVRDSRDPRIIDDTMSVMVLDDASTGDPIATLVNWGNHPEVLSDTNNLITSDFSHYLRIGVENGLPAEGSAPAVAGRGGVCVYLQGSVGGLLTPLGNIGATTRDGTPRNNRDYEKARAVGERLAEKALELAASAAPLADTTLSFSWEELSLPMNNVFFQVIFGVGVFEREALEADGTPWQGGLIDPDDHYPWLRSETFLLRIGEVSFLSVPGELFSELGVGTGEEWTPVGVERIQPTNPNPPVIPTDLPPPYRERMGGSTTFILGLSLDEIGYLVPEWAFELDPTSPYYDEAPGDHYEETNSLGIQTVPILERHLEILFDWPAPEPAN